MPRHYRGIFLFYSGYKTLNTISIEKPEINKNQTKELYFQTIIKNHNKLAK
jgi:hypothetical protein